MKRTLRSLTFPQPNFTKMHLAKSVSFALMFICLVMVVDEAEGGIPVKVLTTHKSSRDGKTLCLDIPVKEYEGSKPCLDKKTPEECLDDKGKQCSAAGENLQCAKFPDDDQKLICWCLFKFSKNPGTQMSYGTDDWNCHEQPKFNPDVDG